MSVTSERDLVESLPATDLERLQLRRLWQTIGRTLAGQPVFAARLAEAGVEDPQDVVRLNDVARLPFSWKTDLRDNYPLGLLAVPREQVARVHASSGSHGKPTIVAYTRADLDAWGDVMARCLRMAGLRPGMLLHNANTYGLFTGGHGFHAGAERLGVTVLPVSGGFSTRQAELLRDLGGQALSSTPSYALVIAQAVREAGIELDELSLEVGLFGGEPFTDAMRVQLERELGLTVIGTYGLSELCGPGVAGECLEARDGLHVQEDHFLVEVVDPETGAVLPDGAEGELVFTTLAKEALPLIRYRTGDLGTLTREPCACGRTLARIASLRGRRDDMLIVRGVNLFPSNVEHLLVGVNEVAPHYRLIVGREGPMDELTVECEPASGEVDREALTARLEHILREHTGIRIRVAVVDPGALPRSEGKAVRVVDRRG